MENHNDATLEQLCDLLAQSTDIRVSRATMGRITQKLNYSVKKKHFTRQRKNMKVSKNSAYSFGKRFETFQSKT